MTRKYFTYRMQLLHLQDSVDRLRDKGMLSQVQTSDILGTSKPNPLNPLRMKELGLIDPTAEVALLCDQILSLKERMEAETTKTQTIKNKYYQQTIQKFKLSLFLNALIGFLDRKVTQLQSTPAEHSDSTSPFDLPFYLEARAQLLALCQMAFPRFQFK